jgi:hypothetical protein
LFELPICVNSSAVSARAPAAAPPIATTSEPRSAEVTRRTSAAALMAS